MKFRNNSNKRNEAIPYESTAKWEEMKMDIRMHIIKESKLEIDEMPQTWLKCKSCKPSNRPDLHPKVCLKCGTVKGGIKEPRFMQDTNHLDSMELFKQMKKD